MKKACLLAKSYVSDRKVCLLTASNFNSLVKTDIIQATISRTIKGKLIAKIRIWLKHNPLKESAQSHQLQLPPQA
jgi:hypothetical protein